MKTKLRVSILALVAMLPALPAAGQVPDQLKYSVPAPPAGVQSGANLGVSVAMDGGFTVVGAPYDDVLGSNSGVVKGFDSVTGALLYLLPNTQSGDNDNFGNSVAISGTRIVVGASLDNTGASNAGSAYVFDLATSTPSVPIATIHNPGPAVDDRFGYSVAISGNRVAVGAYQDDLGGTDVGNAYVYDLGSATPAQPVVTLSNPSPVLNDNFGCSVAISGTHLIVGAYRDDTRVTDAGSAYVYDLVGATPAIPIVILNNPATSVGSDYFGWSVAISGTRAIVGAYSHRVGSNFSSGSAYVYDITGATPAVPIATLDNPAALPGDQFGWSVAISGMNVVVGAINHDMGALDAGSAYVYDLTGATPATPMATLHNPTPAAGDQFGFSVGISGTRVAAGAPFDDTGATDAGSAYLYDLVGATPTVPNATLNNPGPASDDVFGWSVAVSGTRVVVGAYRDDTGASGAGSAYVYDLSSATPAVPAVTLNNPGPALDDGFGYSVAISGTHVVVGAWMDDTGTANAGSAYVYDLAGATPAMPIVTLNNPGQFPSVFGKSVAISDMRVVVGAYGNGTVATGDGSAFVYDLGGMTPTVPVQTLNNPSPELFDYFGWSVGISGTTVVVGAFRDNTGATDAGSVYIYDIAGATPAVPVFTLSNPSPAANDVFGNSVAISGTWVVVGAPIDDTGATDSGIAYVYDLTGATPATPAFTLNNPSPAAGDRFGSSVSLSGTRVVVAAPYDDTGASDAGSAYLYDFSSGTPTLPVATLNNPRQPAGGDVLGFSVAIDGTTVAVGVPLADLPQYNKGAAFIFGPSPYSLWKVSELSNQFAPDLGDADRDGVSNLGEYGLLRSPITPEGAATTAAPALYAEGERLRMFVPRDPARNDITLEVQATGDLLGPWTTIATSTLGAPFTGPGYFGGDAATPGVKEVEVRDTVNIPDAAQRYLRVRVRH